MSLNDSLKNIGNEIKPKEPTIPAIDKELDDKAQNAILQARISMLMRFSFFGNLALRLKLKNADSWCKSASCDGRHLYYNSAYVTKISPDELIFLIAHVILHVAYQHLGRATGREKKLMDIAQDYAVNGDLVDHKIGTRISTALYDADYKGMLSEAIYDDLRKKNPPSQSMGNGSGSGSGNSKIDKMGNQVVDDHLENSEDGTEDENGRPTLTDEELEEIKDEFKEAVMSAMMTSSGAGDIPGNLLRMIQELTNPVISWQDLIQQTTQATIRTDFSFMVPSRRSAFMGVILPRMTPGTQIDLCVAIDQSGSISAEDSKCMLSEVKGIMEQYTEYSINVWCFDTKIYNPQLFTSENLEDIAEYQPMGGGGTDFEVNWSYMKKNGIEPKLFVMFTDGHSNGGWGDSEYCDTVWIIKGNKQAQPPFGIWAYYEDEAEKQ